MLCQNIVMPKKAKKRGKKVGSVKARHKSVSKPQNKAKSVKKSTNIVKKPKKVTKSVVTAKASETVSTSSKKFNLVLVKGDELKNLENLLIALRDMPVGSFSKYVTEKNNSISDWVRFTLKDNQLADEIRFCKDRIGVENAVQHRLMTLHDQEQEVEDAQSFKDLLPVLDKQERKVTEVEMKDFTEDDLKHFFDFIWLNKLKVHKYAIAVGTLFGMIVGFIIGYIFGGM